MDAEVDEFPDCCAVGDGDYYFASGVLIAPRAVLTAKHCRGVNKVLLNSRDARVSARGETIWVTRQFAHEDERVDLRLLVLARDSEVSPRSVALADDTRPATAIHVGFGQPGRNGAQRLGRKRVLEVPIRSPDCGAPGESAALGCVPGIELVAGGGGVETDGCLGDSGGPLYMQVRGGQYLLLGITSRGVLSPNRADGDGGIYVRVGRHWDWISSRLGSGSRG